MKQSVLCKTTCALLATVLLALLGSRPAHAGTLTLQRWADSQGNWVGDNWLAGNFSFPRIGKAHIDDMADVWNDNGGIDIDVHRTTGSDFVLERWATNQGTYPQYVQWVAGDFNCDGFADIADAWEDNGQIMIDVHVSTGFGQSFQLERWATNQGAWIENGIFFAGDFDGNGCSDIGYAWQYNGEIVLDVHKSNGSSFDLERWSNGAMYWPQYFSITPGDFNNDGKTDVAVTVTQTTKGNYPIIYIVPSTGSSFNFADEWFYGTSGLEASQVMSGDFSGDGVDDLVMVDAYTPAVGATPLIDFTLFTTQPATETFAVTSDYSQGVEGRQGAIIYDPWGQYWLMDFRSGDFNGDGLMDVGDAWNYNNTIDIDVHAQ